MRFVVIKKRTLIKLAFAATALVLAVTTASLTGSAAVWQGKTTRKMPICSVETDQKKVALTFDGDINAQSISYILGTMEEHGVCATYFASGTLAERHAAELKSLSDSGAVEIGTQGITAGDMTRLSASKIKLELETSISMLKSVTENDVKLFRPPLGLFSTAMLDTADSLGLKTIRWDVDTAEFKGGAAQIAGGVLQKVKTGSIILIRGENEAAAAALPLIIEGIKNKGWSFATVSELVYESNYTIDDLGKQIRRK